MTQAKTALIIGASRGLGLGLVQQLHADGWEEKITMEVAQAYAARPASRRYRLYRA